MVGVSNLEEAWLSPGNTLFREMGVVGRSMWAWQIGKN